MTLTTRYAEGFLEYAKETIGFEKGVDELIKVKDILRDNPQFKEFLENPAINYNEKYSVIDKVLSMGLSQEIRNFIKLLLKKGRIGRFFAIAEYARIKYSHGKLMSALLYTSYLMDTDLLQKLKNKIEKKFQASFQLYVNLDPEMLGGVRMIIGNKVLDGSVSKRLDDMRRKLLAANVG